MIERLAAPVNADPAIVRWGRRMRETFMVEVGDAQFLLTVHDGRIEKVEKGPFVQRTWRFAIRATKEAWETVWHYMQGGPGVFTGDLYFYQIDGDIRSRVGEIDTSLCPLYLLTDEYDYSASPRDTELVATKVKGAKFTLMKGLGHFPMSENPEAFLGYLRPVLAGIAAR